MQPHRLSTYSRIIILVILVLGINLFSVYQFDLQTMRAVRSVSTLVFLIVYFLLTTCRNRWVTGALVVLTLRDFMHLFFERSWGVELYLALGTLTYILLIIERVPFMKVSGFKKSSFSLAALFSLGNIVILYVLSGFVENQMQGALELPLFYCLGGSLIVLVSSAFYYNFTLNSNRSLLFALMVTGFIIADICACLAYFNDYEGLWYADRLFYAFSLGCLICFAIDSEGARREQEDIDILKDSL
mgnify:CR=1 FL=1